MTTFELFLFAALSVIKGGSSEECCSLKIVLCDDERLSLSSISLSWSSLDSLVNLLCLELVVGFSELFWSVSLLSMRLSANPIVEEALAAECSLVGCSVFELGSEDFVSVLLAGSSKFAAARFWRELLISLLSGLSLRLRELRSKALD